MKDINIYIANRIASYLSGFSFKELSYKIYRWSKPVLSSSIILHKVKDILTLLNYHHIILVRGMDWNSDLIEVHNSDVYISVRYIYGDRTIQNNIALRFFRKSSKFLVRNKEKC